MLTDHHREARRTAIVRLLRHSPVRRQQELVRLLKREGHAVTQSSISRDLRELGVLKASDGYVLPDTAELSARTQDKFSAVAAFVRRADRQDQRELAHQEFAGPRRRACRWLSMAIDDPRAVEVVRGQSRSSGAP